VTAVSWLRRLTAALREVRRYLRLGDEFHAHLVVRAWQLGHRVTTWPTTVAPTALRCRCGWEGPVARGGSWSKASYDHLFDVIFAVDGQHIPVLTEWPPGVSPVMPMHALYAALDRLDAQ
jgi:hypothetical protein